MSTIKTAVSLPEDVFAELDEAAAEARMSRSAVITAAVREYLRRRESRRMLRRLNEVYEEPIEPEQEAWIRQASRRVGERLRDDQW
jgi:predicted transcriptional regulator